MILTNSHHIRNEPCPECRKRGQDHHGDNLGVFSDGHTHCWSCGHGSRSKRTIITSTTKPETNLCIPDDSEPYIPTVALDWIKQYGITQVELLNNHVLYSESRDLLVFPYFGRGTHDLLGWQGRYFGSNPRHPKWFTKGYIKDFIKQVNTRDSDVVVYVEDIISAIKVGRQYCAVPIFGSHIPRTHSIRLNKLGYQQFLIWLDPDKYREAHKFCNEIRTLGFASRVVRSDLDPKFYDNDEVNKYVLTF